MAASASNINPLQEPDSEGSLDDALSALLNVAKDRLAFSSGSSIPTLCDDVILKKILYYLRWFEGESLSLERCLKVAKIRRTLRLAYVNLPMPHLPGLGQLKRAIEFQRRDLDLSPEEEKRLSEIYGDDIDYDRSAQAEEDLVRLARGILRRQGRPDVSESESDSD